MQKIPALRQSTWMLLKSSISWMYFAAIGGEAHLILASIHQSKDYAYHLYIGGNGNTDVSMLLRITSTKCF